MIYLQTKAMRCSPHRHRIGSPDMGPLSEQMLSAHPVSKDIPGPDPLVSDCCSPRTAPLMFIQDVSFLFESRSRTAPLEKGSTSFEV
jgi:hypothetical protein